MKGFIKVNCTECGKQLRVKVNFPIDNKGFETKVITCEHCGTELEIFDDHVYNEDGTIHN